MKTEEEITDIKTIRRREVKYVTYYYSIIGGLSDVEFHSGKDAAVKFYRKAAFGYFDNLRLPAKTTTPTACGFVHRYFGVMSLAKFKKEFPEYFTANEEGRRVHTVKAMVSNEKKSTK